MNIFVSIKIICWAHLRENVTGIEDAEVGTFSAARFLNVIDRLSKYVIGLLLAGAVLTFPEIVIYTLEDPGDNVYERIEVIWEGSQYETFEYSVDEYSGNKEVGIYVEKGMANNTEIDVENQNLIVRVCDSEDIEYSCGWYGFDSFEWRLWETETERHRLNDSERFAMILPDDQLISFQENITFNSSNDEEFQIFVVGSVMVWTDTPSEPMLLSIYFCGLSIVMSLFLFIIKTVTRNVSKHGQTVLQELGNEMPQHKTSRESENTIEKVRFSLPQITTVNVDGQEISFEDANDLDKLREIVMIAKEHWKVNIHPEGSYLWYDAIHKTYTLFKPGATIGTGMFDEGKGSTDDALAYLWKLTL